MDNRDAQSQETIPFLETGDKVAFICRKFDQEKMEDEDDYEGEIILNVLSIDSYSKTMKFELFTTDYDAQMNEGMSDDSIQSCVAISVTSVRGLDVALVAQYNDRIVFDCVTSTKQLPVRLPLPQNAKELELWKETDPDF